MYLLNENWHLVLLCISLLFNKLSIFTDIYSYTLFNELPYWCVDSRYICWNIRYFCQCCLLGWNWKLQLRRVKYETFFFMSSGYPVMFRKVLTTTELLSFPLPVSSVTSLILSQPWLTTGKSPPSKRHKPYVRHEGLAPISGTRG